MPQDKRFEQKATPRHQGNRHQAARHQTARRKSRIIPYGLLIVLGMGLAWLGLQKLEKPDSVLAQSEQPSDQMPNGPTPDHEANSSVEQPTYQTYALPQATVHVVSVPVGVPIAIAHTPNLTTVEAFAQRENALAVINGGFFDPQNGKTTSHLVSQGQLVGDPAENERLMENPNLQAYLPQILNRSEFRTYRCEGDLLRYDIAFHDAPVPANCALETALGAGPQLLPEDTSVAEAFIEYSGDELVRDAIGSLQPNARSATALLPDGTVHLLMVAQRPDAPGMTLAELADFATSLGATKLLNLDGGSSSSLYYNGQTYLGRLDAEDNPVERPVKSVIVVGPVP
jgi:exopolysaccharide biosynthesis protein